MLEILEQKSIVQYWAKGLSMGNNILFEDEIAYVGKEDKYGSRLTVDDLRDASEMDDNLVFDEKKGVLKLVYRKE